MFTYWITFFLPFIPYHFQPTDKMLLLHSLKVGNGTYFVFSKLHGFSIAEQHTDTCAVPALIINRIPVFCLATRATLCGLNILQKEAQLQRTSSSLLETHNLRLLHQSCPHKIGAVSVLSCKKVTLDRASQPSWFQYLELLHTSTLDHVVGIPFIIGSCKDLLWLRGDIIVE